MKTLIHATYYDFKNYEEDMFITFGETILEVGRMEDYIIKGDEIDVSGKLIMPGLVNGHSHIYSTFARGMSVPFNPNNFEELLEQLWWKLDRNLNNEMNHYSAIVSGYHYIKNGVTTIIDHHASGAIKGSLNAIKLGLDFIGQRGIYCFETSDRFNIDDCIYENNQFYESNNTAFSKGLIGLHAAFTLSDETLKRISSETTGPIHIHVAESIMDQELSIKRYGKRVVERLDDFGLIRPNSILTHCLYLDDTELEIIKKRNAVIAVNVTSNMNNGVGLPDYSAFKKYGIKVIVGNDGISQNMTSEFLNLYFSMHHQTMDPTGFGFDDLLHVINNTYNYASEILGVPLGKFERGYAADFAVLDYNPPTPLYKKNMLGHLLFGLFHSYKPIDVYISGKRILRNQKLGKKIETAYNMAPAFAEKLWETIEKEGKQ